MPRRPRQCLWASPVHLLVALFLCALVLTGCSQTQGASRKLRVVTSISPLSDIIARVGGERVEVRSLVPVGTDPHEFEPRPNDVKVVAGARVFFANGLGEEAYLDKLIRNAGSKELRLVTFSEGLPVIREDGAKGEANPHLWLSVRMAVAYAERIRAALNEVDPGGAELYQANAAPIARSWRPLMARSVSRCRPSLRRGGR